MFTTIRPWLEVAYFLSGIVVAIAVVIGLKQIKLLKKDMRLRNERAAKEKAIEYSSRYLGPFVRLQAAFFDDWMAAKLTACDAPITDFTLESLVADARVAKLSWRRFGIKSWLPAMNELEAIAAAFSTGVADEGTGFRIIGRSFCGTVRNHYDIIALCRPREECAVGYWSNIVAMYGIWSPRLQEMQLLDQRNQLETKIAAASKAGGGITPIGVE